MDRICFMVLFLLLGKVCGAIVPDSTFLLYADSIFTSAVDSSTHVRIVHKRHTYFLVTTCKTIPVPYNQVLYALEKIDDYRHYFAFMKRSEFVTSESIGDSVALFEVGVAFYVAWYAGRIIKVCNEFNNDCRLICGNIDQKLFKDVWDGKIGGLIRIRSHDVYLEWRLRDEGMGRTRVSLTVYQAPVVYIPGWLLKVAARKIFPGMLTELNNALSTKSPLK